MGPLLTNSALAETLSASAPRRPVVLDVRGGLGHPPAAESYQEGHLPGAVFVDLDADLAGAPGARGRHPLPEPGDLQRVLRAAGVRPGEPVVVYDHGDGSIAARAWWLLRWAGHDEVAVLDGGYAAWVADGHAVSTEVPSPEPGDVVVRPGSMPTVDAGEAASLARSGTLLDARAPERYRGETEPVDPRAGHVPGALNAPFARHTDERGRWRSPSELAKLFSDTGVPADGTVGAYCGSGVTACSVVLALEVAGRARPAALYPGSWSEWAADADRPAATGGEPG
ncbi:sulfurtransferase [Amycolatopsis minnesotensis]|uniref:Sulfurtransferase n=1 Tax=Amycolatopsis minnesotensis TaxID=337894 RepID=A0ABN2R9I3_9PSEU